MRWHLLNLDELYKTIESSTTGLSSLEANLRLKQNGLNELRQKAKHSPLLIFLNQFKDFMILVLIIAALISGIIGDVTDSIIILVIVFLNAVIGFIQEYRAEKAIEALKKMTTLETNVIRDNKNYRISSLEIVVGDIVLLEAGDSVPADMRIIEAYSLSIDESALTGESAPISKNIEPIKEENIAISDCKNMAFKGTTINNGRGKGLVISTGMNTEIGKIANLLERKEPQTPLQKRLTDFGKKLTYIIFIICLFLFIVGIIKKEDPLEMLLISISLAVAAIPEALPALATISLALGAKKLANQNALIRKLFAVETLGSVTYICSDKTGTLTQNKMEVVKVYKSDNSKFSFLNYSPLTLGMSLNHEVKLITNEKLVGDSTEIAILKYAIKEIGLEKINNIATNLVRVKELPFDSDRKCMTSIHTMDNKYILFTKGAPEKIFNNLTDTEKNQNILTVSNSWTEEGLRVLAFGCKILNSLPSELTIQNVECNFIFAGLVGIIDPPREEVAAAIKECKNAGITPVMITGDHPKTAITIAKELGILSDDGIVKTGTELNKMDLKELEQIVEKIQVYARVSPEQKLNIVKALQMKNHFVCMTGDGVNDAPSLKAANIGVAMGITGTDVSKEAAHMILLDDDFTTIVKAIKEGRRIYENIRKFVKYIMTTNTAEILTIVIAPLIGLPIPLLPIQILWINLVSDGLPGLALVNEKSEPDIMCQPPRKTNESLFAGGIGIHIIWVGILMAFITLGLEMWAIQNKIDNWQTLVFVGLSLLQLAHVMAIRSDRRFLFKQGFQTNIPLTITVIFTFLLQIFIVHSSLVNEILKTRPLNITEWLICIGLATILFHAIELEKCIKNKFVKASKNNL